MIMNSRLVVAERIPYTRRDELRQPLEARLRKLASSLDVTAQLEGLTSNGFVTVAVKGSDSEVFTELIKKKLGLAPSEMSEIRVDDNFKAYTTRIDTNRESVEVEIGPVSTRFKSEIAREALAAQLCDGRSIPAETVARTYCLHEGVPVFVRVVSIDAEHRRIEAWVSDGQASRFEQWRRERFQRIIAVGGFEDEIREAVRLSRVERDVIDVEELALTAHSLVCKLGTDAPGIIAKVGRFASKFKLYAFLPERVDRLRFSSPEPQQERYPKRSVE